MRFGQPMISNKLYVDIAETSGYPLMSYFQMQGAVGDEEDEEVEMIQLVPEGSADYPVIDVLFGEEFRSVRPLMQKFSFLDQFYSGGEAPNYIFNPHLYPPPATTLYGGVAVCDTSNGNGGAPAWTWLAHYYMMFVGVRGSTRYKVICQDESRIVVAGAGQAGLDVGSMFDYPPMTPTLGAGAVRGLVDTGVITSTNDGRGYEFLIPYYGSMKYRWSRWVDINSSLAPAANRLDFISVGQTANEYANDNLWLYMAGGPDITVNRFRRTPTVQISTLVP